MSLNVFGEGGGLEPFEPTTGGDDGPRFRIREHLGSAAAIKVQGPKEATGQYGTSMVIVADVHVLNADGSISEFPKAWLTGKAVVEDLTPMAGRTLAVKFGQGTSKDGTRTFYLIEAPTAKEVAALTEALK